MKESEWGNSRLKVFLECRKKYYWNYVVGLEPKEKSDALSIGGAVHEGLYAFYRDFSTRPREERVITAIAAAVKEVDEANIPPERKIAVREMTITVLDQYLERYKEDNLEIIRAEMPFEIIIGRYLYTGRIDLLARLNGDLYVVEHKTTGLQLDKFIKTFVLDFQTTGYTYAARRITGENVIGAIVNGMKKPRTAGGKVEFIRDIFPRSEEDLTLWEKQIIEIRRDVDRCHNRESMWYQNTSQCVSIFGECPYRRLCMFDDNSMRDTFYNIKGERG